MSWGYVAVGVGTLVAGSMASESAEDASYAQSQSAGAGIAEQRRQYNQIQELLRPYVEASTSTGEYTPIGYEQLIDTSRGSWRPNQELYSSSPEYKAAWDRFSQSHLNRYGTNPSGDNPSDIRSAQQSLENFGFKLGEYNANQKLIHDSRPKTTGSLTAQQNLIGLKGPEAQKQAIADIANSPLFAELQRQGESAILQNASATGGLRGGNIQAALAQFRPRMLQQAIEDQYGRLAGLTSLGQNAAAGVGNAGMQTGANVANLLQQQGAALAGNALAQGNVNAGYANLIPQAAGAYLGYQNNFGGRTAPALTTAQQYGTVPGSQQTAMLQAQDAGF